MKTLIRAAVVFTFAAIMPSPVLAWFPPPIEVDAGFNAWLNIRHLGYQAQLGPWYLYWPQNAHFQTPAPVGGGYPHWPSQFPYGNGQQYPGAIPAPAPGGNQPPSDPKQLNPNLGGAQLNPVGMQYPFSPPPSFNPYPYNAAPAGYAPRTPAYWYGR